jgi:capsular exopolysaccharide synthesis family protein
MIVLVGILLGLVAGLLVAFLREYLDDRIKTETDITTHTDLPVLGAIPHIKEGEDTLKVLHAPKSSVSEAFRNLRTNLQFMPRKGNAQVITVTSTVGGEGKTTVCVNLAGIMSIAGKKTVLVNLDMRKPTLHEKFGLPNITGMSTLLAGNAALKEVIQKTKYDNLDVITSGPVPPNPSELIQTELMAKVIEKLSEAYDVVILDTPPSGIVTDARILMPYADTNIYIIRANYSKKSYLQNLKFIAGLENVHGFGIVVNDIPTDKGRYGYGYGSYGYGYGYGYYEDDEK